MIRGLLLTRLRRNVWINHICLRLHDLWGPFKYGRYRTKYDSTVVNGCARGTHAERTHMNPYVAADSYLNGQGHNRKRDEKEGTW